MSNFWIGFIIGGFICGFIGFLGAAILAASGRASRMEEKIEEDLASLPLEIRVKNHFKSVGYKPPSKVEIATKGKPKDA